MNAFLVGIAAGLLITGVQLVVKDGALTLIGGAVIGVAVALQHHAARRDP